MVGGIPSIGGICEIGIPVRSDILRKMEMKEMNTISAKICLRFPLISITYDGKETRSHEPGDLVAEVLYGLFEAEIVE